MPPEPVDDADQPVVVHVDDDEQFLELVRLSLERQFDEFALESFCDPEQALDYLETADTPGCIVSDYDMPDTDGLALLSAVRERCPEVPFILYTGKGSEEIAADAIARGVSDYLQKDAGQTHYLILGTRIKRELERHRARKQRDRKLAALETAREGICIVDDGDIEYANDVYCGLYGYDRSELLGQPWQTLHPEREVRFALEELLPQVERDGEWSGTAVGLRSDGSEFVESKSVAHLPGGGLVIVVTEVGTTAEDVVPMALVVSALDSLERALEVLPDDDSEGRHHVAAAEDRLRALCRSVESVGETRVSTE